MEAVILDACHSVWIFDMDTMRYCQILEGLESSSRPLASEWRSYSYLEFDDTKRPGSPCSSGQIGTGSSDRGYTVTSAASAPCTELPTSGWRILREAVSVAHHPQ